MKTVLNQLYLKVPFSKLCCDQITIIIKVFKKNQRCEDQKFSYLLAQGSIKVSNLFWSGLKCGIENPQENVSFFWPAVEEPIEWYYDEEHYNGLGVQNFVPFAMKQKLTLLSNLIDKADEIPLDDIDLVP